MIDHERYSRQIRFAGIGQAGQEALAKATVLIVGCGALGTAAAEQLARAGVGCLRLVDRDFVEASNLQRQCLFTEADAAASAPKAVAAAAALRARNSAITIEPHVMHLHAATVAELLAGCTLVIDGCDNFATRHIINESCCASGIPWIYAACVGSYAISMPVLPGRSPCLRCIQDELPAAGDGPTCDAAGIIAPAVHQAVSWQVAEALKILSGHADLVQPVLRSMDLWTGRYQQMDVANWRDAACRACGPTADRPSLAVRELPAVVLCGREAIQIHRASAVDLTLLQDRLAEQVVLANDYLLRWREGAVTGTIFKDGRVLVQGLADPDHARAFCDRWLG